MPSPDAVAADAVKAAEDGNFQAAAEAFAAAIQSNDSDAALHEQLAQCLMELERYDEAIEAAAAATVLDPLWPDAWLTLARASLNSGELQAACEACAKCLELEPSTVRTEAEQEMATITSLTQQHISRLVGLPGLAITADPGGQTGPGCVIWEAGVHLARLFVQLAALQQQGPAHPHANSMPASAANTAPACKHSHVSPTAAASSRAGGAQQGVGTSVQLECVGLQQLPRLQGARLLELGAGTGIAGISAAACGAHAVLTDLPQVQPLLQANIAGNKPLLDAAGGSATAAVLDWAEAHQHEELLVQGPIESGEHAAAGTIISNSPCTNGGQLSDHTGTSSLAVGWSWGFGADLVFNSAQLEPAVLAISTFLRSAEASVSDRPRCFLLAHKQRHLELDKQLLHALAAAGCVAKEVHWSSECAASQVLYAHKRHHPGWHVGLGGWSCCGQISPAAEQCTSCKLQASLPKHYTKPGSGFGSFISA